MLQKIQNPIKFEPFLRIRQTEKPNYPDFISNYKHLFGSKRQFRGPWCENALFLENS